VLHNGEPLMVLSTPGGDNQDQALLQVLLNIIEFGMIRRKPSKRRALIRNTMLLIRRS